MFKVRDKLSVSLVFLSCVVALVMFFFTKADMITSELEAEDRNTYKSDYSEAYLLWKDNGIDGSSEYREDYSDDSADSLEVLKKLRELDYGEVRISFPEYSFYLNDCGKTYISGRYVLYDEYEKRVPLVSGDYSETINEDEPMCVVGRHHEELLFNQGKDNYIRIYGRPYKVIGIAGTEKSEIYDDVLILYEKNTYAEERKCILEKQRCILLIEGKNTSEVSNAVSLIKNALYKKGYTLVDYNDQQIDINSTYIDSKFYMIGRLLLLGLSLAMIIMVVVYWLKRRMYEYSVRKTFGEGVIHIAVSMFVDFSIIYLFAGVVALVIYAILSRFLDYHQIAYMQYTRGMIGAYAKCYVVIVLTEMTVPIVKLVKFSPINLLRDSGEI